MNRMNTTDVHPFKDSCRTPDCNSTVGMDLNNTKRALLDWVKFALKILHNKKDFIINFVVMVEPGAILTSVVVEDILVRLDLMRRQLAR